MTKLKKKTKPKHTIELILYVFVSWICTIAIVIVIVINTIVMVCLRTNTDKDTEKQKSLDNKRPKWKIKDESQMERESVECFEYWIRMCWHVSAYVCVWLWLCIEHMNVFHSFSSFSYSSLKILFYFLSFSFFCCMFAGGSACYLQHQPGINCTWLLIFRPGPDRVMVNAFKTNENSIDRFLMHIQIRIYQSQSQCQHPASKDVWFTTDFLQFFSFSFRFRHYFFVCSIVFRIRL